MSHLAGLELTFWSTLLLFDEQPRWIMATSEAVGLMHGGVQNVRRAYVASLGLSSITEIERPAGRAICSTCPVRFACCRSFDSFRMLLFASNPRS